MADYDAREYKTIDVSGIASLIRGGDETYPKRSEESRRIARVEDLAYLQEAIQRRTQITGYHHPAIGKTTTAAPSRIIKRSDSTRIDFLLDQLTKEPLVGVTQDVQLRNIDTGFVLKPNWRELLSGSLHYNVASVVAELKSLAQWPYDSPNYNARIISKDSLAEQYRHARENSALFVPMWNGDYIGDVAHPSPVIRARNGLQATVNYRWNYTTEKYEYTQSETRGYTANNFGWQIVSNGLDSTGHQVYQANSYTQYTPAPPYPATVNLPYEIIRDEYSGLEPIAGIYLHKMTGYSRTGRLINNGNPVYYLGIRSPRVVSATTGRLLNLDPLSSFSVFDFRSTNLKGLVEEYAINNKPAGHNVYYDQFLIGLVYENEPIMWPC